MGIMAQVRTGWEREALREKEVLKFGETRVLLSVSSPSHWEAER